jgi:hypothetical protein
MQMEEWQTTSCIWRIHLLSTEGDRKNNISFGIKLKSVIFWKYFASKCKNAKNRKIKFGMGDENLTIFGKGRGLVKPPNGAKLLKK